MNGTEMGQKRSLVGQTDPEHAVVATIELRGPGGGLSISLGLLDGISESSGSHLLVFDVIVIFDSCLR
jgi:hypothetical protein